MKNKLAYLGFLGFLGFFRSSFVFWVKLHLLITFSFSFPSFLYAKVIPDELFCTACSDCCHKGIFS